MMDPRLIHFTALFFSLLLLSACSGSKDDAGEQPVVSEPRMEKIRGTLTYEDQILLAPETMVTVQLLDEAAGDTPEALVAESVFHHPGKPPVPFTLNYDASLIQDDRRYSLRARVEEQTRLMFVSESAYPVLPGGTQGPVEILLKRVPGGRMERMADHIRANNPELVGHYRYRDGDGVFIDCNDGSRHLVAREQAVYALESEYRDVAPAYGDEVFLRVAGKYVTRPAPGGRGKEDYLVVMQVEEMSADTGCP